MDIPGQILKLINELQTPEEIKKELAAQLEAQGPTPQLILKISEIIDQTEKNYFRGAEAEMENFKQKFLALKTELRSLEEKAKTERKTARRKTDDEALSAIRKNLNSQN